MIQSYRLLRYVVAAGVNVVVAIGFPYFTVSVPVMVWWTKHSKGYVPAGSGPTS